MLVGKIGGFWRNDETLGLSAFASPGDITI